MGGYAEQYARTQRWYVRFQDIVNGKTHEVESDNYIDDVYAFFMNCYHIRDWLIKDPINPLTQSIVDNHINSTILAVCADICNSIKHLSLDRTPRSGPAPTFGTKTYGLNLSVGNEAKITLQEFWVHTSVGAINAFELATQCMSAWEAFLNNNARPVPPTAGSTNSTPSIAAVMIAKTALALQRLAYKLK